MADLNFRAQIELLDKMTAPMRSISSQAQRLGRQFGETAQQAKKLQSQQRLIDSFKQQKHALAETSEAAQRSRMRLADLQRQMDATTAPSRTLVRQFEAAGRESQRLNTRLDSQRQHLQQLRGRLSDAGIDTRRLSDHERELARQIEHTNQQLGEQRRRLGEVRRLQQQSQSMRDMRGKAAGLAVGGAAATYAGARFISPGLELETKLSEVQALTRLDKNSPQYKALEEQAKMLGATKQFTSADAASGQTFLAMAGFTPKAIEAAMPGMLDLALAGKMDLPQTADIASNILSGMNLDPLKDMGRVGDVLSATFTRANVDIGMLGETLKYAAPGAEMLGVSFEQAAAMAGKLGDNGIQASMAGTAMRSIMSRMASGPPKAIAAFDRLGIKTADANGNLREMPEILKDLHEQTKHLGNTEQAEIFKAIGGEEAGGALKILVDEAGIGELQKLTAELENAEGEAANLARTMSDNTMGDWKATTSAIDAFRTSIFEASSGALRSFLQSITAITQRMTVFANANPELMAVLGKLFATLAIGAVVIGGIGVVMLTILGPMALLKASLITLGLPTTLAPLSMIGAAFTKIKTVLMALRIATLFNPITLGIMAVATAALFIYTYWEPIKAFFSGLWQGISDGLAPIKQTMKDTFAAFKPIIEPIKPVVDALIGTVKELSPPLSFSAETMAKVSAVAKALGYAIGTLLFMIVDFIAAVVRGWVMLLTETYKLWTNLNAAFSAGIMSILSFVSGFVMSVLTQIQNTWTALTSATSQLWAKIKALFSGGIASLVATLLSFSPVGLFIRAFAAVWPYLSGLSAQFKQYGMNMLEGLKNGILGKAQAVINSISSVVKRVKGAFTGARGMDIHSPSRVFTKYGGFMMHGLADGITGLAKMPFKAMSKVTKMLANYSPINLDTITGAGRYIKRSGNSNDGIITQPPINLDRRRTVLPNSATMRSGCSAAMSMGNITININGGADPHATAQMVRREMERLQRDTAARYRSRLSDID